MPSGPGFLKGVAREQDLPLFIATVPPVSSKTRFLFVRDLLAWDGEDLILLCGVRRLDPDKYRFKAEYHITKDNSVTITDKQGRDRIVDYETALVVRNLLNWHPPCDDDKIRLVES
jgi:hypothetical protein